MTRAFPGRRFGADDDALFAAHVDDGSDAPCDFEPLRFEHVLPELLSGSIAWRRAWDDGIAVRFDSLRSWGVLAVHRDPPGGWQAATFSHRDMAADDWMFVSVPAPNAEPQPDTCRHGDVKFACEQCKADHEAELVALELAASEKIRNRDEG